MPARRMDPSTKKTIDIRREARQCPACGQRFSRDACFCPFDGARLEAATYDPLVDALLGSVVDDRYQVVDVLGEGGTGRVYKVRHIALDRFFAMKLLRGDLARDEELAARFIQEAKATASVQHPNVVEITDFGKLPDGVPYLVTELLVGRTLGEIIKSGGPVSVLRTGQIARQIAGALGAAHAVGIVHRDLKPDNVFLLDGAGRGRARDEVRIVDFGAAKVVGASRVTRDGIIFGTPHYMSPEQASGQPVDHRADIYSLGVILYEALTGRVPFEADTYMGVLTQHMFVKPVPPSQVIGPAADLGAFEEITLVCLAKKPEDRYASMERVAAELERAIATMGSGGEPYAAQSAQFLAASLATSRGPSPVGAHSRPSRPWVSEGAVDAGNTSLDDAVAPKRVSPGLAWGWWAGGALLVGLVTGALAWLGQPGHSGMRDARRATPGDSVAHAVAPAPALPSAGAIDVEALPSVASVAPPEPSAPPGEHDTPALAPPARPAHERAHRPQPPRRSTSVDDVGDPFAATR
jgi:eukaryotic-like serine/threonine-protein kinase